MPRLGVTSSEAFALSEEEEEALCALADELEADALRVRREHLDDRKHKVDLATWELVKSKAQLRVFKERRVGSVEWKHGSEIAAQSRVPLLMAQGSLDGTIDEYLYGHFVHDTTSLRMRHRSSKLHVADCAVLTTIEQATMTRPYRFTGIVWLLAKLPGMGLVKRRDALVLTRQRMAHTDDHKPVGVVLSLSITHQDFPEFSQHRVVRLGMASITILRQADEHHVDCFMLNCLDTRGNITEGYGTMLAVSEMLTVLQQPEFALEKKLHYLMRHKKRPVPGEGKEPGALDHGDRRRCGSCGKSSYPRLLGQSACTLCCKTTCSDCRVTKKMCIGGTSRKLTVHRFMFCVACINKCKAMSTELIAKNELEERDLVQIKKERNSAVLEV